MDNSIISQYIAKQIIMHFLKIEDTNSKNEFNIKLDFQINNNNILDNIDGALNEITKDNAIYFFNKFDVIFDDIFRKLTNILFDEKYRTGDYLIEDIICKKNLLNLEIVSNCELVKIILKKYARDYKVLRKILTYFDSKIEKPFNIFNEKYNVIIKFENDVYDILKFEKVFDFSFGETLYIFSVCEPYVNYNKNILKLFQTLLNPKFSKEEINTFEILLKNKIS